MIYIILVVLVILVYVFFDLINAQFKSKVKERKPDHVNPRKTDLNEIYKDITLEPYGCFSSLDEKFFLKKETDSSIIISNKQDTIDLIKKVNDNGFDIYANKILHKDLDKLDIFELGVLGKLAGYNYLSVYKIDENTQGKVYLTYSPPMDKAEGKLSVSDLPGYTLKSKPGQFTNETEKAPGKELSCGYPCNPSSGEIYMCGSVGYPDIKTPSRFAVYHIKERF